MQINNGHHWTFITDKQKGLKEALNGLWEERSVKAEHRHCARHLQGNFTKVRTSSLLVFSKHNITVTNLINKIFTGFQGSVLKATNDDRSHAIFS